jgi:hypothetical protein
MKMPSRLNGARSLKSMNSTIRPEQQPGDRQQREGPAEPQPDGERRRGVGGGIGVHGIGAHAAAIVASGRRRRRMALDSARTDALPYATKPVH